MYLNVVGITAEKRHMRGQECGSAWEQLRCYNDSYYETHIYLYKCNVYYSLIVGATSNRRSL